MPSYDRQAVETALRERSEELRRTRAAMKRDAEGMVENELSHLDNHPADADLQEQELDATTETFFEEEERRIVEAQKALEQGTYGTCADCGKEIPAARLEAMPATVRCVDCQRRHDARIYR